MWRQPPIWEPQGTKFRPYSITTLIFFYIGKFFGRLFGTTSLIVVEHEDRYANMWLKKKNSQRSRRSGEAPLQPLLRA